MVDLAFAVGCLLRLLVACRPVPEPGPRLRSVVSRSRPSLVGHLVRWRDIEVRGEAASLVVAHEVVRHRQHFVVLGIQDGEAQAGDGEDL